MPTSKTDKDTVILPVNKDTMKCTFMSCPYTATDHWSGTQEELLYIMEGHVRTEHPAPMVVLVEGYVDRVNWDTFRDWWSDYRAIFASHMDTRATLTACMGAAAGRVLQELGMAKFMELTEMELPEETERIAVPRGL